VCDATGAVRGHPGVYVMDGSLLPTAPGVNPHETIAGFVTVLARRLLA
jgi:cholesterol oxidase